MLKVPEKAGLTAVIEVGELTVKLIAGTPPNATAVAPVKLVPVIVTLVPPAAGPDVGLMPVTVGAGKSAEMARTLVVVLPPLL